MYLPMPGVRKRSSRYERRFSSLFSTPIASKRRLMVLVLSSAARIPLPGATSVFATAARSAIDPKNSEAAGASEEAGRALLVRSTAMAREEVAQDALALLAEHAHPPAGLVVEPSLVKDVGDRDNRAGLGIRRAEHHERHACEH